MNMIERLIIRLGGRVYLEDRARLGWSGTLPFYAFNCKEHGVVENYPMGFDKRLECPKCIEEGVNNLSILEKYIIMLLGANQEEPIPSLMHLKGELIICAKIYPELQKYIDEHGGIKLHE